MLRIQVFWVVTMHHWVSDHHHFEESKSFHLQRSCPLQITVGLFLALNMQKTHCAFTTLSTIHPMTEHHIPKDLNPGKSNHVIWWKMYLRTVTYCSAHLSLWPLSEETVTCANTSTVLMDRHVMQKLTNFCLCACCKWHWPTCIPYILESNPHSVFGDFLNGKKLVCNSNPHLSFHRPLLTGRLTE
jgi:hypothetical protein